MTDQHTTDTEQHTQAPGGSSTRRTSRSLRLVGGVTALGVVAAVLFLRQDTVPEPAPAASPAFDPTTPTSTPGHTIIDKSTSSGDLFGLRWASTDITVTADVATARVSILLFGGPGPAPLTTDALCVDSVSTEDHVGPAEDPQLTVDLNADHQTATFRITQPGGEKAETITVSAETCTTRTSPEQANAPRSVPVTPPATPTGSPTTAATG